MLRDSRLSTDDDRRRLPLHGSQWSEQEHLSNQEEAEEKLVSDGHLWVLESDTGWLVWWFAGCFVWWFRIALLTAAVARALLCTNQTVRLEDVRRELLQMWGMLFDDCWLVLLLLLMTIAGMLMMIVVRPHVN